MARGFHWTLSRAAARAAGKAPPIAGLKAVTKGEGGSYRTIFTFNGMQLPVPVAQKYAGLKIFDFTDGKIRIKGGTSRLQFAVLTARGSTIINSASLAYALGSAVASNVALTSTMVNVLASTTRTLDGAGTALSTASTADIAAASTLDGTTTAIDLFLNAGFATGTDVLADGILAVTGKIDLLYENWGDNVP